MDTQQEILKGYNEIRKFLRISTNKAKNLVDKGAPVTIDNIGRPRANKHELWHWFQQNPTIL